MIRFGVLTISDRAFRGERIDQSGPVLIKNIKEQGWILDNYSIVPDEAEIIEPTLIEWVDKLDLDVILTTGGTGFSQRDVTPEATMKVIEKPAPGIAEAIRMESLRVTPHAMLSRGIAGIRKNTLIINFSGSPKAAAENFATVISVIPHAVELIRNDPDAEQGHTQTSGV